MLFLTIKPYLKIQSMSIYKNLVYGILKILNNLKEFHVWPMDWISFWRVSLSSMIIKLETFRKMFLMMCLTKWVSTDPLEMIRSWSIWQRKIHVDTFLPLQTYLQHFSKFITCFRCLEGQILRTFLRDFRMSPEYTWYLSENQLPICFHKLSQIYIQLKVTRDS